MHDSVLGVLADGPSLRMFVLQQIGWCADRELRTHCWGASGRERPNLKDGLDAKVEGRAGALARAQLPGDLRADLAPLQVVLQLAGVGRAQGARLVALRKLQRLPIPVCLCVSTYSPCASHSVVQVHCS